MVEIRLSSKSAIVQVPYCQKLCNCVAAVGYDNIRHMLPSKSLLLNSAFVYDFVIKA